MNTDVYFLCYTSKATAPIGSAELAADITDIITIAPQNNRSLHLTGALLYANGYFCQILEGPRGAVTSLIEKIKKDPRHQEVRTHAVGYRKERTFSKWSMGYTGDIPSLPEEIQELMTSPDDMVSEDAGAVITRFLLSKLEKH